MLDDEKCTCDSARCQYPVQSASPMMTVQFGGDTIQMRHSANYICGGVTGHATHCDRTVCRRILHSNCTSNTVHYTMPCAV